MRGHRVKLQLARTLGNILAAENLPMEWRYEQSSAKKPPANPDEHLNNSRLDSTKCIFCDCDFDSGEER